jgi:mono/diheme cytochrome c family protein
MKYPGIYLMIILFSLSVVSCNTSTNNTAEMDDRLKEGKELFTSHCANCHKSNEDFTGPALAQCRKREPNEDWAYSFVDSANRILQTDLYAISLREKYGTEMTQFDLSKDQIRKILDYCDSSVIYEKVNTTP